MVMAGPEHHRSNLVREAAADLDAREHMTGYVSHRQPAACYECAGSFAFPSLFEGCGIPALEAIAHRTPVVCAKTGTDAALYFDPLDGESIAAALKRVLTDAMRAELSQAGRAREHGFGWRRTAKENVGGVPRGDRTAFVARD